MLCLDFLCGSNLAVNAGLSHRNLVLDRFGRREVQERVEKLTLDQMSVGLDPSQILCTAM